jgi:hypothetical protein
MANTVLSNTNLEWVNSKTSAPFEGAEFDLYTYNHNRKMRSIEVFGEHFENSIGVDVISRSTGKQIILAWREADAETNYTGNSSYIVEGWD